MTGSRTRNRAILRRLAAAVLLRAVDDARDGDLSAARWLLADGAELAVALGIGEARLRAWDQARRRCLKRMPAGQAGEGHKRPQTGFRG